MNRKRLLTALVVVILLTAGGYVALDFWLDSQAEARLQGLRQRQPLLAETSWKGVDTDLLQRTVTVSGLEYVTPWGGNVQAARVVLERFDTQGDIPTYADVSFAGVRTQVTPRNLGPAAEGFERMGYETLACTGKAGYEWDPATNELEVYITPLTLADAGTGGLRLRMSGADLRNWRTGLFLGLSLLSGEVNWKDQGLRRKWLSALAEKQDMSPELLAATMHGNLRRLAKAFRAEDNPVAARAAEEMGRWVEHGGDLHVALDPEEPLPYLYLFMGQSLGDLLELSRVAVSVR